jgi:hypothetical protein
MLARKFEPVFSAEDLVNIPNHDIHLKLMIDGAPSKPFSATTLRSRMHLGTLEENLECGA